MPALLTLPGGASITNTYDPVARLTGTYLQTGAGATLNSHAYVYDVAGRRAQQTRTDGSYVNYAYDNVQQLTAAFGYEAGGASRLHERFGCDYDPAGNLNFHTNNQLVHTFRVNATNQISVNLAATNTLVYDANGNLRTNGAQVLEYDDDDRLASNYLPGAWRSDFAYDGLHRRRMQWDCQWEAGDWHLTNYTLFLYDGNLPIRHRDMGGGSALTLTRGADLSGALQGAGGIGGLLAAAQPSSSGPQHFYYHADAGGNVTALVNDHQVLVGRYLYDPFGRTLAMSGPMQDASVSPGSVLGLTLALGLPKQPPVVVTLENVVAPVAAVHHVIDGARILHS